MKYIAKSHPLTDNAFVIYYEANHQNLQNAGIDGREIWKRFTDKRNIEAKTALRKALLEEQGYICCYCGSRIEENEEENGLSIEHFHRKGIMGNKHLVLEYTNLMACCKQSQKIGSFQSIPFPIDDLENTNQTLENIANFLGVDVANLKRENNWLKNLDNTDDLVEKNNQKPSNNQVKEIKYKENIHHCDDTKDLARKVEILNPTIEVDCEYLFIYTKEERVVKGGKLSFYYVKPKSQATQQTLINDTIKYLNLNADDIAKKRWGAYEEGMKMVGEYQTLFNEMSDEEKRIIIDDVIQNKIYAKQGERLTEFCFVTASIFHNSFL